MFESLIKVNLAGAIAFASIAVASVFWTYYLLRLPGATDRVAFDKIKDACNTGADINKRMGQIIEQLGQRAAERELPLINTVASMADRASAAPFITQRPQPQNGSHVNTAKEGDDPEMELVETADRM